MPYIKKTVKAGLTMEVFKYHSARYQSQSGRRQKNRNKTPLSMAKVNQRNAENKLRWKINANFGAGDIYLTLTYTRANRPDAETAAAELRNYLRRLRRIYKTAGAELKYIAVTETGSRGGIHHHMVINSGIDTRLIAQLWTKGIAGIKYLDNTGEYGRLAGYLIKETSKTLHDGRGRKLRYTCSRNLKEPEIKTERIKADTWTETPRAVKGYALTGEVESGVIEATGYGYQHYTMRKL